MKGLLNQLIIGAVVTLISAVGWSQTVFVQNFSAADGLDAKLVTDSVIKELTKQGVKVESTEATADVVVSGKVFITGSKITMMAKVEGKKIKKVLGETHEAEKTEALDKATVPLSTKVAKTLKDHFSK